MLVTADDLESGKVRRRQTGRVLGVAFVLTVVTPGSNLIDVQHTGIGRHVDDQPLPVSVDLFPVAFPAYFRGRVAGHAAVEQSHAAIDHGDVGWSDNDDRGRALCSQHRSNDDKCFAQDLHSIYDNKHRQTIQREEIFSDS